jgi:hypothetical protein
MTLTCTWVKDPAGSLVMKWTVDEVPMRQRRNPQNKSEGRHATRRLRGVVGRKLAARSAHYHPARSPFETQSAAGPARTAPTRRAAG